ncbi:XTP/dITP diphosphatase [candidate division TA06 bacterium]|nr:XTP/dITP diphosphatase [candidate division TA06 bacterium]
MVLILATRNPDKIEEIQQIFQDSEAPLLSLFDFPQIGPVEETGKTLEENAVLKAKKVSRSIRKVALADDTGLEVEALQGRPGVHSARFAGPGASYEANRLKLLKSLQGVPEEKRGAVFRCIAALASPEGRIVTFEGVCRGRIGFEPKGEGGFGYDPLFIVEGIGKTFAEMTLEEKNQVSHRAKAMKKVMEYLKKKEFGDQLLENRE